MRQKTYLKAQKHYGQHRKLGVGFHMAGNGWHRSQWVKHKLSSVQFIYLPLRNT